MEAKVNRKSCPVGTRALVRFRPHSTAELVEVEVLEWSGKSRLKYRYCDTGNMAWTEEMPTLIEVLSHPQYRLSGDDSREMWDRINGAKTTSQLRDAVYELACRCQGLEDRFVRHRHAD
jgi:hypothetical protein